MGVKDSPSLTPMQAIKRTRRAILAAMKHGPHKEARAFVGRRLRALREARELKQDDLAREAGVQRSYIGVIERGDKGVGIDMLGKLCDALGISFTDFFNDNIK